MTIQKHKTSCLGQAFKGLLMGALALCLALAGLAANQRLALAQTRQNYPAPGRLVQVDGRTMHLNCQGSGSPTVVIDAGNSSFSLEWTPIKAQVSPHTRVCTYDRAGYGWSEPGPAPRDGIQAAAELYRLLQVAGEPGPYLLVGHSLGGVHVRIFAAQHPSETAGLVLLDTPFPLEATPELETQRRTSIGFYQVMKLLTGSGALRLLGPLGGDSSLPATARKLPPELQATYLNLLLDPVQYDTAIAEMEQLPGTVQQASAMLASGPQPFGDLPLLVLVAGQRAAQGATPFDERQEPVPASEIESKLALAAQSAHGEARLVENSGHAMHQDAPQAVVEAILDVLDASREVK